MELRQYLAVIGKWLWLVVLSVAIAATSSYLASRQVTPIYRTKTTLMIGQAIQDPNPSTADLWTGQQLALTYIQLVRREPVLQGAIESLDLQMDWRALVGRVNASIVQQTQLLEISVVDSNPYRAKALADAIAEQLILLSPATPSGISQEDQAFAQQQLDDIRNKIEETRAEIERLQQELDAAISARQIQDLQNQTGVLQTKVSGWQNTYAQLLTSLQGGEVNVLSVVEEAAVPTYPIGPNVKMNVLLASAIGLILAAGGAFLIEYLDDTIKTPDDVTRATNLPTIGAVTRIEGATIEDKLVTADHPRSPVSEAYRALRTNLQFSAVDKPLKTLLITSANPIEGKSLTAANLGVAMAQAGLSVVIVDSDLRRPVQHRIFRLTREDGLTNALLKGSPNPDGYLQETEVENLRVLTSGPLPPNPSELLGSERMSKLIEHLKDQADILIFDSPPCLAVTDAAVLSSQVDGVLLVVDAGASRRELAARAVEDLRKVGGNMLGAVLNRLSPRGSGYYYYYYYYSEDGDRAKRHKRRSLQKRLSEKIPVLKRFLGERKH